MTPRATRFLLTAIVGVGCNATPIPQPPPENLDVGKIAFPETWPTTNGVPFFGHPGAAPPHSVLRITNLDTADPPYVVEVAGDGSFSATISAEIDDELRFQVRLADERKTPIDLLYLGGAFEASARIACFSVALETDLGAVAPGDTSTATVTLENDCDADADVDTVTLRTLETTFAVVGAPPATVPAQSSVVLDVSFSPESVGETEEVLLITVQIDGEDARYPVTLFGAGD